MIAGDIVFDAFINANILFIVAFSLWRLARFFLNHLGLKYAHATQLKLLNTVFLTIVFSPFLILGATALQHLLVGQVMSVNLSDMVVSHYLNGGLDMRATDFEHLVLLRDNVSGDVLRGESWLGLAILGAFAAGLIAGAARLVYSVFCLRQIVSSSYAWRRIGRVAIRLSDRTLVPFSTRGLRSYYIVIPSNMLGHTDDLRVSLAHEFQHLRQGDIEWEILLEALKPVFFLNPAYHAWKRQVEDLRELVCDSHVLTTGRISIKTYADTLLRVCQHSLRRDRVFVVAVPKVTLVTADRSAPCHGRPSFLEERIKTLFTVRRLRHPKLLYTAIALPMLACVMLSAIAIQPSGDWSQDRLMLSTIVNLERLDEINRMSTFASANH